VVRDIFFGHRGRSKFAPRYSTFVRIGSGLSYADYVWVRSLPWKEWNPKNPPEFLRTASGSRDDKGDLYLEPEEFGLIAGSTVMVLNYVTQFLHR
jgi:DNA ligase-4